MSRPVAGVRKSTIIITLPGSPKGARENLEAIIKMLPHACLQAQGANSRALHAGGMKQLEKSAGFETQGKDQRTDEDEKNTCQHTHSHHHAMPVRYANPMRSNDPDQGPTQRNRESPYPMMTVEEALVLVKQHSLPHVVRSVAVSAELVGSVLAEDVVAAEAVPAYRASIVDGYAINVSASEYKKGVFPLVGIAHAKASKRQTLQKGQLARITTGAPVPEGNDISVIMVEDTTVHSTTVDGGEELEIEVHAETIRPGANVREIGSDIVNGTVVLKKGECISSVGGELAVLASIGVSEVKVYQKPTIGVLSTGDEIVPHDRPGDLSPGEVRDSNRPALLGLFGTWTYPVVDLGIVADLPTDLEVAIRHALRRVDVLVTTGGVSMGELDLLKPTIERKLGGTIHFGRVAMKPGKPTTFASVTIKDDAGLPIQKSIFALPGNPVSALVTANLFVLPALQKSAGLDIIGLPSVRAVLKQDFPRDMTRREYHRAVVAVDKNGVLLARSTGGQRSSRVASLRSANALIVVEPGEGVLKNGSLVEALLMGSISSE